MVLPWLIARLLTVPVLTLSGTRGPGQLIAMDGQWFRLIAIDWYDRPYAEGFWSEYPFFPLLPAVAGGLMKLGLGPTTALAGLSWAASLAALAGAYRLAIRHLPPRAASWAPWFIAIAPGALTMVLGYADSLFLAGAIWALVLADDRRWWAAGVVAVVATSSRPNGFVAVIALVVTVFVARAGARALAAVAVPSLLFLGAWGWYLWWATSDPLVFWSAKDAWDEISLAQLVDTPLAPRTRGALFHVAALVPLARLLRAPCTAATARLGRLHRARRAPRLGPRHGGSGPVRDHGLPHAVRRGRRADEPRAMAGGAVPGRVRGGDGHARHARRPPHLAAVTPIVFDRGSP